MRVKIFDSFVEYTYELSPEAETYCIREIIDSAIRKRPGKEKIRISEHYISWGAGQECNPHIDGITEVTCAMCRRAAKDAVSAYLHTTQINYDPAINGQMRTAIDVAIDRVVSDLKGAKDE